MSDENKVETAVVDPTGAVVEHEVKRMPLPSEVAILDMIRRTREANKVADLHIQLSALYPELYRYEGEPAKFSLWGFFPWMRNASAGLQARAVELEDQQKLARHARDPEAVKMLYDVVGGGPDAVAALLTAQSHAEKVLDCVLADLDSTIASMIEFRDGVEASYADLKPAEIALAGGDPEEKKP